MPKFKRLWTNIEARLGLLKIALSSRYINGPIMDLARGFGPQYFDVIADAEPFELFNILDPDSLKRASELGFDNIDPSIFMVPGTPSDFNSEPSVGQFLGRLICALEAQTVLELGSFVGLTSAYMTTALRHKGGGTLFAVDPSERFLNLTQSHLQSLGLESHLELRKGMSTENRLIESLPNNFDLIFIDTSHQYPATLNEIEIYSEKLSPKGMIALHDSISAHGVRKSLIEMKGFRSLTFATERSNGLTLLFRGT